MKFPHRRQNLEKLTGRAYDPRCRFMETVVGQHALSKGGMSLEKEQDWVEGYAHAKTFLETLAQKKALKTLGVRFEGTSTEGEIAKEFNVSKRYGKKRWSKLVEQGLKHIPPRHERS